MSFPKRKEKPEIRIVKERCFFCQGQKEVTNGLESNGWDTQWITCPTCKGIGYIEVKYKKVRKVVWERV